MIINFIVLCYFTINSQIIKLNHTIYDNEVSKYENISILFYSKNCKLSQATLNEYYLAVEILSKKGIYLKYAIFDTSEEKDLYIAYNITKYPTLRLIIPNETYQISGKRNFPNIINWIEKIFYKNYYVNINSPNSLSELLSSFNIIVSYYGAQSKNFEIFKKVSEKLDDKLFVHLEYLYNDNISDGEIFIIYNEITDMIKLSPPYDENEIFNFVTSNLVPLVSIPDEDSIDYVFNNNKNYFIYFYNTSDILVENVIREVSNSYKGLLYFFICNSKDTVYEELSEYYSIGLNELPLVRLTKIINEEEVYHYSIETILTNENLKNFIDNFLNNKLTPIIKSEPIPEIQMKILKIVGRNFNNLIMDSVYHVILLYMDNISIKSQDFFKIFNYISLLFGEFTNIKFASVDVLNNDIPYIDEFEDLPYIKVIKSDDKKNPIKYNGKLSSEELVEFINKEFGLNKTIDKTSPIYVLSHEDQSRHEEL